MTDSANDQAMSAQSAVLDEVCESQVHKDKDIMCTINSTGDQVLTNAAEYSASSDKGDNDPLETKPTPENITVETVEGNITVETVEGNITVETVEGNVTIETVKVSVVGLENNNDIQAGITEMDAKNIQTEKQVTQGDSSSEPPVNDVASMSVDREISGSREDTACVIKQEHLPEAVLEPATRENTASSEMSHVQDNCVSDLADKTMKLNQIMDTSEENNAPACSGVAIPPGTTEKGSPQKTASDASQGKPDILEEGAKSDPTVTDNNKDGTSKCDDEKQGCEESDGGSVIILEEGTVGSESNRNKEDDSENELAGSSCAESNEEDIQGSESDRNKEDLTAPDDSENEPAGSSCAECNEDDMQSESSGVSKRGDNIFTNLANICVGKIYVEPDEGSKPGINDLPSISEMLSEISVPEKSDNFRVSLERLPTDIVRRGSIDVQSCRIPSPMKTPRQDKFSPRKLNIKKEPRSTAKGISPYNELKPLSINLVRTDDADLEMLKCKKKLVISMMECQPGTSPVRAAGKTKPSTSSSWSRLTDNSNLLKKIGRLPEDEMSAKWLKPFEKGWKRELKPRLVPRGYSGKLALQVDVYYKAPCGRKFRSMPSLHPYLQQVKSSLKLDNFTFRGKRIHKKPYEYARKSVFRKGSSTAVIVKKEPTTPAKIQKSPAPSKKMVKLPMVRKVAEKTTVKESEKRVINPPPEKSKKEEKPLPLGKRRTTGCRHVVPCWDMHRYCILCREFRTGEFYCGNDPKKPCSVCAKWTEMQWYLLQQHKGAATVNAQKKSTMDITRYLVKKPTTSENNTGKADVTNKSSASKDPVKQVSDISVSLKQPALSDSQKTGGVKRPMANESQPPMPEKRPRVKFTPCPPPVKVPPASKSTTAVPAATPPVPAPIMPAVRGDEGEIRSVIIRRFNGVSVVERPPTNNVVFSSSKPSASAVANVQSLNVGTRRASGCRHREPKWDMHRYCLRCRPLKRGSNYCAGDPSKPCHVCTTWTGPQWDAFLAAKDREADRKSGNRSSGFKRSNKPGSRYSKFTKVKTVVQKYRTTRSGCGNCQACSRRQDCGRCGPCLSKQAGSYDGNEPVCQQRSCIRIVVQNQRPNMKEPGKISNRQCGQCKACKNAGPDCGKCDICKKHPKFGGDAKVHHKCRARQCEIYGLQPDSFHKYRKPGDQSEVESVLSEVSTSSNISNQPRPSTSHSRLVTYNKHSKSRNKKWMRHCGECVPCKTPDDCGRCTACKDKRKFGGADKLHRKCLKRQCLKFGMFTPEGNLVKEEPPSPKRIKYDPPNKGSQPLQPILDRKTENRLTRTGKVNEPKSSPSMKTKYCGRCQACQTDADCGRCYVCKDKKKFGGSGRTHLKCLSRQCEKTKQNTPSSTNSTDRSTQKRSVPSRQAHKTLSVSVENGPLKPRACKGKIKPAVEVSFNVPGKSSRRCGECTGCLNMKDCGKCDICLDRPIRGGEGRYHHRCRARQCLIKGLVPGAFRYRPRGEENVSEAGSEKNDIIMVDGGPADDVPTSPAEDDDDDNDGDIFVEDVVDVEADDDDDDDYEPPEIEIAVSDDDDEPPSIKQSGSPVKSSCLYPVQKNKNLRSLLEKPLSSAGKKQQAKSVMEKGSTVSGASSVPVPLQLIKTFRDGFEVIPLAKQESSPTRTSSKTGTPQRQAFPASSTSDSSGPPNTAVNASSAQTFLRSPTIFPSVDTSVSDFVSVNTNIQEDVAMPVLSPQPVAMLRQAAASPAPSSTSSAEAPSVDLSSLSAEDLLKNINTDETDVSLTISSSVLKKLVALAQKAQKPPIKQESENTITEYIEIEAPQEPARPVVSQEPQRPVILQELPRPVISQAPQKPLISQESQSPVISQEPQQSAISQELQRPVISQETRRPVASLETRRPVASRETRRRVASQEEQPSISIRITNIRSQCPSYLQQLLSGYECMQHIFSFLDKKDLKQASLVCRSWLYFAKRTKEAPRSSGKVPQSSSKKAQKSRKRRRTYDTEDGLDGRPDEQTRKSKHKHCHIQKLQGGIECLLHIFSFLDMADLMRVSQVCKVWRAIVSQKKYWRTIRLRKYMVKDWPMAVKQMNRLGTENLVLQGLVPVQKDDSYFYEVAKLTTVQSLKLGGCSSQDLSRISRHMTQLQELVAESISSNIYSEEQRKEVEAVFKFSVFSNLSSLKTLKLRWREGLTLSLEQETTALGKLSQLTTLSLTSLKCVQNDHLAFMERLVNLETLILGECYGFTRKTFNNFIRLRKLKSLRLEHGKFIMDEQCVSSLQSMRRLEKLDLFRFPLPRTNETKLCDLKTLKSLFFCPQSINLNLPLGRVNEDILENVRKMSFLSEVRLGLFPDKKQDSGKKEQTNLHRRKFIPLLEEGKVKNPKYTSIHELLDELQQKLPNTKILLYPAKMSS